MAAEEIEVRGVVVKRRGVVVTWLLIVAIRRHGFTGLLRAIQGSPFLLMCSVVTVVGCTFVGLATLNFGSLARYRVPFLPFYGALVVALARPTAVALVVPKKPKARRVAARPALGRATG